MKRLTELEDQIKSLNALNTASAKALDTFADTSNSISVRARQITRDVKPWEVAQENIALTIEEMSKAARCYHPPPSLYPVLSKKDSSPEAVSRCIDYLVYTDDYLTSHPPNDYADEIHVKIERQLRQIVGLSEELVKKSFMQSLLKPSGGSSSNSNSNSKAHIIKDPEALKGIGLVVQRLGENFNRTDVVAHDVCNLLQQKLKALIESKFDATFHDEDVGKTHLSTHASLSPVMKHYQRGAHPLLAVSKLAREAVTEIASCMEEHILIPLDCDYAVAEMPCEAARTAFDIVTDRAHKAILFDPSMFANPTQMFIDSRGQGIGLVPGTRYFRDVVFVGLNLVEEMWSWKTLSNKLPGEKDNFIDYVDNAVENFIFTLREMLDGYVACKGTIRKDILKELTLSQHKTEWIPPADCTAHESTTNVLYFHKVLLGSYYGAMKVVLYGNTLSPDAEIESIREVEDYLIRSVLGTIQDLETIVDTAVEMQADAYEKRRHRFKDDILNILGGGGGGPRLSKHVFLVNNIAFLEENYRREKCFQLRLVPRAPSPHKGKRRKEAKAESVVTHILAMLRTEGEGNIKDFGHSWEECFPSFAASSDLASISPVSHEPLRKAQRMAVKHWNRDTAAALASKIRDCKACAVLSSGARTQLIDLSVSTVREQFQLFDNIICGRVWSTRPQKWMPLSIDEWVHQIRKIF